MFTTKQYQIMMSFFVRQDRKWGIVNDLGVRTVACKYDTLIVGRGFNHVIAVKDNKYGTIDLNGNVLIDLAYEDLDYAQGDSIALIKQDGKWGMLKNGSIDYSSEEIIFVQPDQKPLFEWCAEFDEYNQDLVKCAESKMVQFIFSQLNYPAQAVKNKTSGKVYISFVIDEVGSIQDAKILRDIGDGCGAEALRVVNKMDNWFPAKRDGERVKSLYTLPVVFKLK